MVGPVPVTGIEVVRRRDLHRLPGATPAVRHGIAVVDASTALLQAAALLPPADVVTAADAIGVDGARLVARAEQWIARGGAGRERVRELIAALEAAPRPDSVLEERFVRMLQRSGIGRDAVLHHRVTLPHGSTIEVDLAFPAERVVIELDGWRYHRSPESFRSDRSRDVELAALGWVVLRFTHADVDRRPRWVLDQIQRTRAARRCLPEADEGASDATSLRGASVERPPAIG